MVCRRKEERYGVLKEGGRRWCVEGRRKEMVCIRKLERDNVYKQVGM